MTAAGWTFMLASLVFVWVLVIACYRRVLGPPRKIDAESEEPRQP